MSTDPPPVDEGRPADPRLAAAEEAFLREDYVRAEAGFLTLQAEHAGRPFSAEAGYWVARCRRASGNGAGALAALELPLRTATGELSRQARLLEAEIRRDRGEDAAAAKQYEALLPHSLTTADDAKLAYLAAVSRLRAGDRPGGVAMLRRVEASGRHPWAEQARHRIAVADAGFCVQVGAFSDRANAEKRQAEIESLGHGGRIVPYDSGGRPLFLVLTKSYDSLPAAESAAGEIEGKGLEVLVLP